MRSPVPGAKHWRDLRDLIAALERRVRVERELLLVPRLELVAARRIGDDQRRIERLRRRLA